MNRRGKTGAGIFHPRLVTILLCIAPALLTGCTIRGPQLMPASRLAYNDAVQVSDQRELLLNLVRLRYLEAPEFLAVSSISTQMQFEAGGSVGGQLGEAGADDIALLSPGAEFNFSESPTITFVPQRDQELTRQLVTPVPTDTVYLLTQYGWGLDRVLTLVADEINGVTNRLSREGTPDADDALLRFRDLMRVFRRMEDAGLLRVVIDRRRTTVSDTIPEDIVSANDILTATQAGLRFDRDADTGDFLLSGEQTSYVLEVKPEAWSDTGFREVADALGLVEGSTSYDIEQAEDFDTNSLHVSTRSVLGAMAYLSNAVSIPVEHQELIGEPSHDPELFTALLDIRVAESPQEVAFLQVEHRGLWFYLDDRDSESKRTLGLLTSLIRLSINAGGTQNAPILTLPVSR